MYNADVYTIDEFNKFLNENVCETEIVTEGYEWFFILDPTNPPYDEEKELYEMMSESLGHKIKELIVDITNNKVAVIYE